jgi:hypothetical protein
VLAPERVHLTDGGYVAVDGVSRDPLIFVEAFAHQGKLKGSQPDKVACDALKLAMLGAQHPGARLILLFADVAAAAPFRGKTWLA